MGKITVLPNNPTFEGLVELVPDVLFDAPDGKELRLHLIKPWGQPAQGGWPLVVFIQGSAWTKPNQLWEAPQLSRLAARGFVVASVTHRSCFEAKAPAFLQDVKTALRFLRAHAQEYGIDGSRVCAWGTSSGGNTALLLGLTGDDAAFETEACAGQSTRVQAVVDCFGPTDLMRMVTVQYADQPLRADQVLAGLGGVCDTCASMTREEAVEAMRGPLEQISPIRYVKPGLELPPFLLLHGDADPVVRYEDTEAMYEKLCENGYEADLVRVTGAEHEGSFWSPALLEIIFRFIEEKLEASV